MTVRMAICATNRGMPLHFSEIPMLSRTASSYSEEWQWLILADCAEDGAHYFDAVVHGAKLADGTFRVAQY